MKKSETKTAPAETRLHGMPHLKVYNKQDLLSLTRLRRFETKVGEQLQVLSNSSDLESSLKESPARFFCKRINRPKNYGNNCRFNTIDKWLHFGKLSVFFVKPCKNSSYENRRQNKTKSRNN